MAKSRLLLLQEDMALDGASFDIKPAAITNFEDSEHEGQCLKVDTITTHSGMLINNRVYPGVNMRRSVGSWTGPDSGGTAEYNRPVLLNHNTDGKPIGRVVGAKFTPLTKGDAFTKDFLSPVVIDRGSKVDVPGSGYITTTSIITDEDAIVAILKGEYKTVSASFHTDKALCSICGNDYIKGGYDSFCGHWPGETYDIEVPTGKKDKTKTVQMFCYAITGSLFYREWSYVNVPADAAAQTIKMEKIALDNEDSECYILRTYSANAKFSSVTLCDTDGNSLSQELLNDGDKSMNKPAKETGKTVIAVNAEIEDELAKNILKEEGEEVVNVDDQAMETSNNAKDSEDNADQKSTPAGETDGKEEPANSDSDDSTDADVSLSDDEFALASVARSMGTCLLTADSSELMPVNNCSIEGEDHSHRIIIQRDGDTFYGKTYDHEGEGKSHEHVYELNVSDLTEDDSDLVDLLGPKSVTRGSDTGPDHTHNISDVIENVEAEGIDMSVPSPETLKDLLEKLDTLETGNKLSEDQLEKLKTKTFCGPNRSFPVPDCDHIRASLRLLGRYKGRADVKSRIASSIRRNGRDLGYESIITDTEKKETEVKDTKVNDDKLLADYVRKSAELEAKVATLTDQLSDKTEEIKNLTDASVTVHKALNTALAHQLVVTRWVLDKDDTLRIKDDDGFAGLIDKYSERSSESLRDSINDLMLELDIFLRDHRGGINKRILSITQKRVEEDDTQKQVLKSVDKTNTSPKVSVKRSKPSSRSATESLSEDLAV